jgi:hypothetical protein
VFITTHWTLASGAPARPVSSGRSACEGAKRADAGQGAPACPVSFCEGLDTVDRTLAEYCSVSSTLTWQCAVRSGRTGRWPVSGHGAPDAFGRRFRGLNPLGSRPDAEVRCVRCDTMLHPVILLTVGARSDRLEHNGSILCGGL